MLAEQRHGSLEVGVGRAAGAHPAIADLGGAADRVRMPATEPDRRMRLLDRSWAHGAGVELIDGALVADLRRRPQHLDQLHLLAEAPDPVLARHLELRVVLLAAQPDAENRPAVARII